MGSRRHVVGFSSLNTPASKNPARKKLKERTFHCDTHPEPLRRTPAGRSVKATRLHVQHTNTLTHPQVVHLLAHAAVLFWDLLKVLVKARLQWQEARQGWEVRLWEKSFTITSLSEQHVNSVYLPSLLAATLTIVSIPQTVTKTLISPFFLPV